MPTTEESRDITAAFVGLGSPSRTEAWFALGKGWEKLPHFAAAQQGPFLPKRWAGRSPSLVSLTVHIFHKVVARRSRRVGKQKRGMAEWQTIFFSVFSQKNRKVALALFPSWTHLFPQKAISFMLVLAIHLYLKLR